MCRSRNCTSCTKACRGGHHDQPVRSRPRDPPMSGSLKRAKLVPYDAGSKTLQTAKAIKFDFNPETLTLKVSTGQQQDKSRRGRQQVQSVGASSATLNFEAI